MPLPPRALPLDATKALEAWRMMGKTIAWDALDTVCGLLAVEDEEIFVHQLFAIRDHVERLQEATRNA